MSQNAFGWLYQLSNRLPEAEAAYAESLALYKQLDLQADFPRLRRSVCALTAISLCLAPTM